MDSNINVFCGWPNLKDMKDDDSSVMINHMLALYVSEICGEYMISW